MIHIRIILLFFFCFTLKNSNAQTLQTYEDQKAQIFRYNLLFNGIASGVGGLINKNPGEQPLKVFGRSFIKGLAGGAIKYACKQQLYYLRKGPDPFIAYTNRALFYLGHSVARNGSLNKGWLATYRMQLFGLDLELITTGKLKLNPRISVYTAFFTANYLFQKEQINLEKSLQYGVIYFDRGKFTDDFKGWGELNNIGISRDLSAYSDPSYIIPHELAHTYQPVDFNLLNSPFKKVETRVSKNLPGIHKYLTLDLPWFNAWYQLQPKPVHYKNFYEFEAQHFATRKIVIR